MPVTDSLSNIIISRTDSIGDVMLTLPMARVLKEAFPGIRIGFLGKSYTAPVIKACRYVDDFIDLEDFMQGTTFADGTRPQALIHVFPVAAIARQAKRLGIPLRIGTTNRLYHWPTCNKLVKLSRKNSPLHEAQLNIQLLASVGINTTYSPREIGALYGFDRIDALEPAYRALLDPGKYNLVLHPKSQGSAREWGTDHFLTLIRLLDKRRYKIFISGTSKEQPALKALLEAAGDAVTDISGLMSLNQFIAFLEVADGLVAASTGPLHIAAALGRQAIGIFAPVRPVHPGRWAPLGPGAQTLVLDRFCEDCKKNKMACHCISAIEPVQVMAALEEKAAAVIQEKAGAASGT